MTGQRLRLNDGAEIFVDDDNHVIHTRRGVLYTGATEDAALRASVTFYDQHKAALTPRDAQAGLEAALEVLIRVAAETPQCVQDPERESCLAALANDERQGRRRGWNKLPQDRMCPACALYWSLQVARNHLHACMRLR